MAETEAGSITGSTKVRALAEYWLDDVRTDPDKADSTKERYRVVVESFLLPRMAEYRLREVSVPVLERVLRDVGASSGAATAKGVKSVLGSMLGLAVRHGALPSNPVRDTRRISVQTEPVRALTADEAEALLEALHGSERAATQDLVDLCEFMLGTGVRLGEALALQLDRVDLKAGTVEISRTLSGNEIKDRTKTKAGWRVIAIPAHLLAVIQRRIDDPGINTDLVVFPSPLGCVRNVSNTTGMLRHILDDLGYDWVHSHTFRKTVATRLDEAGLSPRQIADHLGHSRPSMTMDVYMGRKVACSDAVRALSRPAAAA